MTDTARLIRLPTFSGTKEEDVDVFLLQFDNACDAHELPPIPTDTDTDDCHESDSEDTKDKRTPPRLTHLIHSLRGKAAQLLVTFTQHERDNYYALRDALLDRYRPSQHEPIKKAELRARKRMHNEDLVTLAQDIKLLTAHAYPHLQPDVRDEFAKDAFTDALDIDMRDKVLEAEPRTLAQALRRAMVIEGIQARDRKIRSAAAAELTPLTQTAQLSTSTNTTKTEDELVDKIVDRLRQVITTDKHKHDRSQKPARTTLYQTQDDRDPRRHRPTRGSHHNSAPYYPDAHSSYERDMYMYNTPQPHFTPHSYRHSGYGTGYRRPFHEHRPQRSLVFSSPPPSFPQSSAYPRHSYSQYQPHSQNTYTPRRQFHSTQPPAQQHVSTPSMNASGTTSHNFPPQCTFCHKRGHTEDVCWSKHRSLN